MFKTPKGTPLQMMELQGRDYLPVAQRLIWFREERANWRIETRVVREDIKSVLVMAKILDEQGNAMASAHKECPRSKRNPVETAETGAIGRALGLLGYGTQFMGNELDEGDEIADAPISTKSHVYEDDVSDFPRYDTEQPSSGQDDPYSRDIEHISMAINGDRMGQVYKVPFGKFFGRTLESIDRHQMQSYADYLSEIAKKEGKPLSKQAQEYIVRVADYVSKNGI